MWKILALLNCICWASGGHDFSKGSLGRHASSAELTSLAHSSALQAKTAVQNQHTAGSHAAFTAKSNLAIAASGAASTAQAALVGKRVHVQNLKKQLADAEKLLQAEVSQYELVKQVADAAKEAAQQAQAQLSTLQAVVAASKGGAQHASQAASEASGAGAAQQTMIQEAKQRVAHLTQELHDTLAQLKETEGSAAKAAAAAAVADHGADSAANAVAAAAADASSGKGHDISFGGGFHR